MREGSFLTGAGAVHGGFGVLGLWKGVQAVGGTLHTVIRGTGPHVL